MSFSNVPDAITLGRVAGTLAVDEAFVEKVWYLVQGDRRARGRRERAGRARLLRWTSRRKGDDLIKRFSEDIDFKLNLSPDAIRPLRPFPATWQTGTKWQPLGA